MISHKYKFIFVHIPKTAGTSVKTALNTLVNPNEIINVEGHEPTKYQPYLSLPYTKFTIIRNPWDRAVSSWKWVCTCPFFKYYFPNVFNQSISFKRWMIEKLPQIEAIHKNLPSGRFQKLSKWMRDKPLVDGIISAGAHWALSQIAPCHKATLFFGCEGTS